MQQRWEVPDTILEVVGLFNDVFDYLMLTVEDGEHEWCPMPGDDGLGLYQIEDVNLFLLGLVVERLQTMTIAILLLEVEDEIVYLFVIGDVLYIEELPGHLVQSYLVPCVVCENHLSLGLLDQVDGVVILFSLFENLHLLFELFEVLLETSEVTPLNQIHDVLGLLLKAKISLIVI